MGWRGHAVDRRSRRRASGRHPGPASAMVGRHRPVGLAGKVRLVTMASLEDVRRWIAQSQRIVVLTGAGISTDSGIPDFRGPNGLWTKNPEAEKIATLQHYLGDPEVRKRAWRTRLDHPAFVAQPNDGHRALVELERQGKLLAIVTQNIDELHQRAGSDPARVIEMHGTVHHVVCWSCGERAPMERALARVKDGEEDPPCRSCGGILKSATVSFGQNLDRDDIDRAEIAVSGADLLLCVGTTLTVYPVAGLVPIASRNGVPIVIVNAEPTAMDDLADAVLRGSISELLPALTAP
jgi:NAD-dependent deacetylase